MQKVVAVVLCVMFAGIFSFCGKRMELESQIPCDCEDELYSYFGGEKDPLLGIILRTDYLFVGFEPHVQNAEIVEYIKKTGVFNPVHEKEIERYSPNYPQLGYKSYLFVHTKKPLTCSQLRECISMLEKSNIVSFANFAFCNSHAKYKTLTSFSEYFHVDVKNKYDLDDFYAVVQETNTQIVRQGSYTPESFILQANKYSKGNAPQMSIYFYETGKFALSYSIIWTNGIVDGKVYIYNPDKPKILEQ